MWFKSQPEIWAEFYTRLCFPTCPDFFLSRVFPLLSSGFVCSKFCFFKVKNTVFFCWMFSFHVQLKSIQNRTVILCYYLLPSVDSFQSLPAYIHKPIPSGLIANFSFVFCPKFIVIICRDFNLLGSYCANPKWNPYPTGFRKLACRVVPESLDTKVLRHSKGLPLGIVSCFVLF